MSGKRTKRLRKALELELGRRPYKAAWEKLEDWLARMNRALFSPREAMTRRLEASDEFRAYKRRWKAQAA